MVNDAHGIQRPFLLRWILLVCLLTASSCSAWKETGTETFELPTTRMSPDSVALEITFVRIPLGEANIHGELWQQVDEQCLPVDQRAHLNNNGFRCGLLGTQLPDVVRNLLDEQQQATKLDEPVASPIDILARNRRVQNRAGQRTEIVTRSTQDHIVVLHKDSTQQKVGGKTFADAQCILASRTFPHGDGTVDLELTPEVHHGSPQRDWVVSEGGTLHLLAGREREVFQDLSIKARLGPGQTLLLSCTEELKGVGHNFFAEPSGGSPHQKLLLIRLSQTQRDELFDTPLATETRKSAVRTLD